MPTKFFTLTYFLVEVLILKLNKSFFLISVSARLSLSEQASCEGSLTLTEASEALQFSNRNKSPGPDGLTVEFYAFFWDKLGETLVSIFNQSLACGDLPNSMKASVTRLVHKKDDKRDLKKLAANFSSKRRL